MWIVGNVNFKNLYFYIEYSASQRGYRLSPISETVIPQSFPMYHFDGDVPNESFLELSSRTVFVDDTSSVRSHLALFP